MTPLREWLARVSYAWLQRLFYRQGLRAAAVAPAVVPEVARPAGQRVLLHVGCGHATMDDIVVSGFRQPKVWREIRLDADETVAPDLVGTMVEMSAVPDAFADAIFSSHGIEHLYWHDVPRALAEFHRVLAADGFAVITCPDLQSAAKMIAEDRLFETAYDSAAGAITPFDILYSYRPFVAANPQWMSHHCGFTLSTLISVLRQAGFQSVQGVRRLTAFDLWVLASKSQRSPDEMAKLAEDYLLLAH
jgi:hypothetical protein